MARFDSCVECDLPAKASSGVCEGCKPLFDVDACLMCRERYPSVGPICEFCKTNWESDDGFSQGGPGARHIQILIRLIQAGPKCYQCDELLGLRSNYCMHCKSHQNEDDAELLPVNQDQTMNTDERKVQHVTRKLAWGYFLFNLAILIGGITTLFITDLEPIPAMIVVATLLVPWSIWTVVSLWVPTGD